MSNESTIMDEATYRQRHKLVITSFSICVYYITGGRIESKDGTASFLGINDINPEYLKIIILCMMVYFAVRYYHACKEKPNAFIRSIEKTIEHDIINNISFQKSIINYAINKIIDRRFSKDDTRHLRANGFNLDVLLQEIPETEDFRIDIDPKKIRIECHNVIKNWILHTEFEPFNHQTNVFNKKGTEVINLNIFISFKNRVKFIVKAANARQEFLSWVFPWFLFWAAFAFILCNEITTLLSWLSNLICSIHYDCHL